MSDGEIKFRAWHENQKCWWYFDLTDLMIGRREIIEAKMHLVHKGRFTGLKDKNGKEIYESDLLLHRSGEDMTVDIFMEVVWDEDAGGWGLRIKSQPKWADYLEKQFASECEIIGNIYENRELLK